MAEFVLRYQEDSWSSASGLAAAGAASGKVSGMHAGAGLQKGPLPAWRWEATAGRTSMGRTLGDDREPSFGRFGLWRGAGHQADWPSGWLRGEVGELCDSPAELWAWYGLPGQSCGSAPVQSVVCGLWRFPGRVEVYRAQVRDAEASGGAGPPELSA